MTNEIVPETSWGPTSFGLNDKLWAEAQIMYARQMLHSPVWGMSPSSSPDDSGNYNAYGEAGDTMAFYEIDPLVPWLAEQSAGFTFLSDARSRGAHLNIVLGDARLTIQSAPDAAYDVLVLDAFSGDAIPVHLLTRQALEIYLRTDTRMDALFWGCLVAIVCRWWGGPLTA